MVTTFTEQEKKILKKFVIELKKTAIEIKKKDGVVREVSIGSIIKNALKE